MRSILSLNRRNDGYAVKNDVPMVQAVNEIDFSAHDSPESVDRRLKDLVAGLPTITYGGAVHGLAVMRSHRPNP